MSSGYRVFAAVICLLLVGGAWAAAPKATPKGTRLNDHRFTQLRTLNSYFPFAPVDSKEAWARRAASLRRQVRVATGLWPEPTKTPLKAIIHGRVEREKYTVDRVMFESLPGHYVTGSLYRPKASTRPEVIQGGRRPAVLSPHGHWAKGRFHDHGEAGVRGQIAIGAERFEVGGRHPLQARMVQLARMGCVVFHYDMVGYADSIQFPEHRPGVREQMNRPEGWGYFSPQAEGRLQNMMGLQTWNSIRAIDFILSLADVDAKRLAVTGASGGGTQTFMIGAVDARPAVLFPAVMVSTGMQGGCTCEGAPMLRVGAGNIDLAALAAPRPLGLTSADDWTKQMSTKGAPDLAKLYAMLGHKKRFGAFHFTHFKHNYNAVSRMAMYGWLNRHLKLGLKEPVLEKPYKPLSPEEMTVWTKDHPKPAGDQVGEAHERAVVAWWTQDARKQLNGLVPTDDVSLKRYREVVGGAIESIVGRRYETAGTVMYDKPTVKQEQDDYLLMTGVVTNTTHKEQLPLLFVHPTGDWNKTVVIWVDGAGKSSLLDDANRPIPPVKQLVAAGYSVIGIDLFGQGEWAVEGKPFTRAPMVRMYGQKKPWHRYAGYTYGYNRSLMARRAHDVLSVIRFVRTDRHGAKRAMLMGVNGGGPVVAVASALAEGAVARTAIDTRGFRFADLTRFDDLNFLPGGAKYHDLPGLLALCAPAELWVGGEDAASMKIPMAAFGAAGKKSQLTLGGKKVSVDDAVKWLTR